MHALLDQYLCEKYPKIFADRHKPMSETCMCWGFECGNGWFTLIDALCGKIQAHIDQREKDEKVVTKGDLAQVVAHQVKEKFSSLRFYYGGGDEYIEGMVDLAEELSMRTCEQCGATGHDVGTTTKGWLSTLCRTHVKNSENFSTGDPKLQKIWEQIVLKEESKQSKA